VPYGDWLVGFSEMLFSDAMLRIEFSVRPVFSPITLVGVFSRASSLTSRTRAGVIGFPVFRVYFGINVLPVSAAIDAAVNFVLPS
jgi:hypothetical protein